MRVPATLAIATIAAAAATPAHAGMRASFLYPLSDSVGKISLGWAPMFWDAAASELYVVDGRSGVVDVFNDNGMVVHSFGDAADFAGATSVVVLDTGEPIVLANRFPAFSIVRCNYRGEKVSTIELREVPPKFMDGFFPGSIHLAKGQLYLADKASMKVLVVDLDGTYVNSFQLAQLIGVEERKKAEAMMRGFSVDGDGNLLFTVATLFQAFVVSPEGTVRGFGMKGSLPGKFQVAGGIVADDDGHLFIADTLRCVVMAFDRETLAFLGEFSSRGRGPSNLVNPLDIAVGNGRVFVTQSIGAVKVFGVIFD